MANSFPNKINECVIKVESRRRAHIHKRTQDCAHQINSRFPLVNVGRKRGWEENVRGEQEEVMADIMILID